MDCNCTRSSLRGMTREKTVLDEIKVRSADGPVVFFLGNASNTSTREHRLKGKGGSKEKGRAGCIACSSFFSFVPFSSTELTTGSFIWIVPGLVGVGLHSGPVSEAWERYPLFPHHLPSSSTLRNSRNELGWCISPHISTVWQTWQFSWDPMGRVLSWYCRGCRLSRSLP